METENCPFMAKGETDEEVMDKMMMHMKEAHPEKMMKMNEEEMRSSMRSKIKEM